MCCRVVVFAVATCTANINPAFLQNSACVSSVSGSKTRGSCLSSKAEFRLLNQNFLLASPDFLPLSYILVYLYFFRVAIDLVNCMLFFLFLFSVYISLLHKKQTQQSKPGVIHDSVDLSYSIARCELVNFPNIRRMAIDSGVLVAKSICSECAAFLPPSMSTVLSPLHNSVYSH